MPTSATRHIRPSMPASSVQSRHDSWYSMVRDVRTWERDEPCTACELHKTRRHIVDTVFAPCTIWNDEPKDRADIMFVGRDPGREEDAAGFPFVGPSGVILASILTEVRPGSVAVGNVTRCIGTGPPSSTSINACAKYLDEDVTLFRPRAFLLFGNEAISRFGVREKITSVHGKQIKTKYGRAVAAFHPAYILRNGMRPLEAYRTAIEELRSLLEEPDWFG